MNKLFLIFLLFFSTNLYSLDSKYGKYEKIELPEYFEKKIGSRDIKRVSGQELAFRFIKKKSSLNKYPGKAIEGMIWMELFYNESIKYPQAVQEDKIEGMWEAKTNLRSSMGFTNDLSTQEVIDKYLVLRKILLQAKVKKVKIDTGLKERKELLKEVKSKIKKAKKVYLENTDEETDDISNTKSDNKEFIVEEKNKNESESENKATNNASNTIKDRLIKLEDLYEEGLITKEEYKTKRLEILDDL